MTKDIIWQKIQNIVQGQGGRCHSVAYKNNISKLSFECREGHSWETSWKSLRQGSWCPRCAIINSRGTNHIRFDSLANMQHIAELRGGKCLSDLYQGSHVKLTWQCMLGHTWAAKPSAIKLGTWCPSCSVGIGERVCRLIFETIFQETFTKIRPEWLKNQLTGRNLELDGYCEKLNIAFEYNGSQHYSEVNIYSRSKYDQDKINKCRQHNVNLFIIKEIPNISKYTNIIDQINCQAQGFGIKIPSHIDIPIHQVYQTSSGLLHLEEISKIASQRGGKCLSQNYVDNSFKLDFQCGDCHYIWKSSPNSIKNGTWCPQCANKCVSLFHAQQLATHKGGRCVSAEYINSTTKMMWECQFKHTWQASYNQIQSGNWCPVCFKDNRNKSKKLPLAVYQQAANNKGGECLSTTINSCYDKLLWKCQNNHEWYGTAHAIKNTKQWCPMCAKEKRKKHEK
jgi:hypothetical protein